MQIVFNFLWTIHIFYIIAWPMQILFNYCIGNANSFFFLHRQWDSFLFLALGIHFFYYLHGQCKFFLFFALAMGFFFLFLALGMQNFFIICMDNTNYFQFLHRQCKLFMFFALTICIAHAKNKKLDFPM